VGEGIRKGENVRVLVCVDARGWEAVVRGAARHLREGEAILVHVVDERAQRGHELAVRGLLGRRRRGRERDVTAVSQAAAEELLADAQILLEDLRPGLTARSLLLEGVPNEELVSTASELGADAVFVGRGTPHRGDPTTISGTVSGWKRNRPGDVDGLLLDDGTEVGFPPHRAADVRSVVSEGAAVEVSGVRRGERLHAHRITDLGSGTSVEAHKPPRGGPEKRPLGHTARFVVDHAPCDVVVLSQKH